MHSIILRNLLFLILERRIEELEYEKSSTLGMLEKRIYELETEKETVTVGMKD